MRNETSRLATRNIDGEIDVQQPQTAIICKHGEGVDFLSAAKDRRGKPYVNGKPLPQKTAVFLTKSGVRRPEPLAERPFTEAYRSGWRKDFHNKVILSGSKNLEAARLSRPTEVLRFAQDDNGLR